MASEVLLTDLVRRINYRDVEFTVHEDLYSDGRTVLLRAARTVPDSYTGRPVHIVFRFCMPKIFPDEEYGFRMLRARVHEMEMHEADEFLLVDGERRYDPHASHVDPR